MHHILSGLITLLLLSSTTAFAQSTGKPATSSAQSQSAPAPTPFQQKVEAYVRHIFAWGASFQVKVGTPTDAAAPGFYQVNIEVTVGTQSDSAIFYVSKDGRFILRGDLLDTTTDPFVANRAKMDLQSSPAKGPADARVTVVEYSDFQCPHCRELTKTLRTLHTQYPQVRIVFKDLPLVQIHPWAMTAAVAGRCAYQQSPEAFWKVHDAIFDHQDAVKPENAWDKMLEFGTQAGLDLDTFRACMVSEVPKQHIVKSVEEAKALKIANTPTSFVNGRRVLGTDRGQFDQFISFELAALSPKP